MSTLKVSNIQHENTSNGGITIDSSGHVSVEGQSLPSAGPLSNRNLIINGAMKVWQRGTAFASDAVGGGRYTADRWNVPNRTRVARSTDAPAGFTHSLLIDREQTGGTEPFTVSTGIEVQDITQTGSYTLSFFAKSADITTLNINVQDRTGVAEGGTNNSSIVTNQAVTIDNTWTRYTHTFTLSSVSFTGTSLRISIGNTSAAQDDEVLITGVQLEVGSVATPFEHRSFGDELARCQRYYERIFINSNGNTDGTFGLSNKLTNALAVLPFYWKVEKRTNASFVLHLDGGTLFQRSAAGSSLATSQTISVDAVTSTYAFISISSNGTTFDAGTIGQVRVAQSGSGNASFKIDAEL